MRQRKALALVLAAVVPVAGVAAFVLSESPRASLDWIGVALSLLSVAVLVGVVVIDPRHLGERRRVLGAVLPLIAIDLVLAVRILQSGVESLAMATLLSVAILAVWAIRAHAHVPSENSTTAS